MHCLFKGSLQLSKKLHLKEPYLTVATVNQAPYKSYACQVNNLICINFLDAKLIIYVTFCWIRGMLWYNWEITRLESLIFRLEDTFQEMYLSVPGTVTMMQLFIEIW